MRCKSHIFSETKFLTLYMTYKKVVFNPQNHFIVYRTTLILYFKVHSCLGKTTDLLNKKFDCLVT